VRVLRIGDDSEAATQTTRAVFVVGLSERAWPRPRPASSWPRATALALETLHASEAPPLALALHGFARLLALPCPLYLSRPAWMGGAESGASPLLEDLTALFPGAKWPALPVADASARAATRSGWLRLLARASQSQLEKSFLPQKSELEEGALPACASGERGLHPRTIEGTTGSRAFEIPSPKPEEQENSAASDFARADDELRQRLRALDSMRQGRASVEFLGRYDGVLGERGRELVGAILAREEDRLIVSPSGVEGYARCPIRFFFERVIGLPDEGGAEDDLSRAESGDLVHRVLHSFRREWHAPLGMDAFEPARQCLAHLTQRACDSLGLPPILRRAEARRLLGTEQRPGALVRLLRAECLEADAKGRGVWAHPLHPLLHLAQGRIEDAANQDWTLTRPGNGLEQGFRLPLDGALVQGRIDRIDASPDGSLVVVLDYKTGSASSLPSFAKGSDRLSFQLAVYVLAAAQLVSGWSAPPQIAASYLSPRAGFVGWTATSPALGEGAKSAMSDTAMTQWLADSCLQIERIATLIEAGTFNLSLQNAKIARCDGCAQRALCGQNASRQSARAGVHLGSNVVFLPERIEWSE